MAEINIDKMAQNVARKALQGLRDNGVFVRRWIPVSERLPNEDERCNTFLVTDNSGRLSLAKFYFPLPNSAIDQPCWSGMIDVVAWMPLPEPYKAESEESDADSN